MKARSVYKNKRDDEIVTDIAAKYGFKAFIDVTEGRRNRVQKAKQGDWDFIRKLARINNYDASMFFDPVAKTWEVVFVKRRDEQDETAVLEYRPEETRTGSLLSVQFDFAVTDQTTNVEILYRDRKNRKLSSVFVSEEGTGESVKLKAAGPGDLEAKKGISLGSRLRIAAFGSVVETFTDRPFASVKEAKKFAEKFLKERDREFLKVTGKVVGFEILRVFSIVELRGVGNRLSGKYRLTNVRHVLTRGEPYVTEFEGHRVVDPELTRLPRRRAGSVTVDKEMVASAGTPTMFLEPSL